MKIPDLHLVLTGASGGIGRACALALSRQGARIIAVGRTAATLQQLMTELKPHAITEHTFFCADIADSQHRQQLVTQLNQLPVPPNGLINMAGYGQLALLEEQAVETIETIIQVNVTATILLTQALLPLLKQQPHAIIVNVGSVLGSLGYPGQSVYCASKFALRGFSEALRRELVDTTISVQYFAPRATKTSFNSDQASALNQRLGNGVDSPEAVAKALLRLVSSGRHCHTSGLPERLFIVLNHLMPALVNGVLKKQLPIIKSYASSTQPGGN